MWESETLWQLMTCCVILHNMIVKGEGDGVAQTNDFEARGEQVEIPEDQDATQLMNFLRCIRIFEIIRCTRNYLTILWSICGPTMENKELMFELCT